MITKIDQIALLESSEIVMQLQPVINLTDDQFYELCQLNQDLRMERTAKGELIIMPPVGGEGSKRNADLTTDLNIWNRQTKLGVVFDSSGGFKLPNGGDLPKADIWLKPDRSPDASWVKLDRWNALISSRAEYP